MCSPDVEMRRDGRWGQRISSELRIEQNKKQELTSKEARAKKKGGPGAPPHLRPGADKTLAGTHALPTGCLRGKTAMTGLGTAPMPPPPQRLFLSLKRSSISLTLLQSASLVLDALNIPRSSTPEMISEKHESAESLSVSFPANSTRQAPRSHLNTSFESSSPA